MSEHVPVEAVVFDFDGTIIDTETPVLESWQEVFRSVNIEPIDRDIWVAQIGRSERNSLDPRELLRERLGVDQVPAELEDMRRSLVRSMLAEQPIRAGVVDWITAVEERGLALGIASSSPTEWVDSNLRERGLREHFTVLSCADPGTPGKPDPAVYLQACDALGVAAERAVAIEDSPNGVRGARAAGLRCIAAPGPITVAANFDHATVRVDSLGDIDPADWLHHTS